MTADQLIIIVTLCLMLVLFAWGKWRYDLVSLVTLLVVSIIGIVPTSEAFKGFGNPAVITVAAVLVVSRGLMNSGIVDYIAALMFKVGERYLMQLAALVVAVTLSSAFMNNIGALALFMPIAIRIARKSEKPPSLYLMPLAFGSLLGGLITLVGTPPNIIISNFRADALETNPFRMFDFAPVGAGVALAGLLFILLLGWRLIPKREGTLSRDEMFKIGDYITALKVPEDIEIEKLTLKEIERFSEGNVLVISHVRNERNYPAPSLNRLIRPGDTIIVQGEMEHLQEVIDHFGFKLSEADRLRDEDLSSDDIALIEATVTTNSMLINQTARSLQLRTHFNVNLLGVARQGARHSKSPDQVRLRAGDVLLLQGAEETFREVLPMIGCLPLAQRDLRIGKDRRLFLGIGIFAVAIVVSALGLLPVQIAFASAAALMVIVKLLTLKEAYESIDWPIIILLGALIPVSRALETTGSAQLIADTILKTAGLIPAWSSMMILMLVTMLLSNVVNNAAAALIMAPIAVQISIGLGTAIDPFLMAVAVGASCAFLTPIGHQSNTLVLGPGGYRFGDYWRLGLPLSLLVIAAAAPLILLVWPL
jgi:di/tricarboxylate transporter